MARNAKGQFTASTATSTHLDRRGVKQAMKEALAGKGAKKSPLLKCALAVKVAAQRSMQGGKKKVAGDTVAGMSSQQKRAGSLKKSKRKTWTIQQPSQPGSPPNSQQGQLKGSITAALNSKKDSAVVGPTVRYGRIQEFGGHIRVTARMRGYLAWAYGWHLRADTTSIHLPARPYMRPALAKARPRFRGFFRAVGLDSTPTGRRMNSRKGQGQ